MVQRTKADLFLALSVMAFAFSFAGCNQFVYDPMVWKLDLPSPDGAWVATARTDQWGGFGTAYVETTVSIRKVSGNVNHGKPFDVFSFPGGGGISKAYTLSKENADHDLQIKWTSAKQLEIAHKTPVEPDLAVIRFSDVDIEYTLAK